MRDERYLKKEITKLEEQLEQVTTMNRKKRCIKNLKISARFLERSVSYVLCAGLAVGAGYVLTGGGLPIVVDEFPQYAYETEQFDTEGIYEYKKIYQKELLFLPQDVLYVYGDYVRLVNGLYERTVDSYDISEAVEEQVNQYMVMEEAVLREQLGEPYQTFVEGKGQVTKEELMQRNYRKAAITACNKNDVIMVQESASDNLENLAVDGLLWGIGGLFVANYRRGKKRRFKDYVEQLEMEYELISDEKVQKKLALKKDLYNNVRR